jgi:hypothetical protein
MRGLFFVVPARALPGATQLGREELRGQDQPMG